MNIHRIRQKQQNTPFHHRKNIFKILYFRRDINTNFTFFKMLKHLKTINICNILLYIYILL